MRDIEIERIFVLETSFDCDCLKGEDVGYGLIVSVIKSYQEQTTINIINNLSESFQFCLY